MFHSFIHTVQYVHCSTRGPGKKINNTRRDSVIQNQKRIKAGGYRRRLFRIQEQEDWVRKEKRRRLCRIQDQKEKKCEIQKETGPGKRKKGLSRIQDQIKKEDSEGDWNKKEKKRRLCRIQDQDRKKIRDTGKEIVQNTGSRKNKKPEKQEEIV
jgi:hypothetical protein